MHHYCTLRKTLQPPPPSKYIHTLHSQITTFIQVIFYLQIYIVVFIVVINLQVIFYLQIYIVVFIVDINLLYIIPKPLYSLPVIVSYIVYLLLFFFIYSQIYCCFLLLLLIYYILPAVWPAFGGPLAGQGATPPGPPYRSRIQPLNYEPGATSE